MSKEDKQRILATNRLLEILRAERSTEETEEPEQPVVESELLSEDDNEELQYVSQSESGESSESIQSSAPNFTSLFTDEQHNKESEQPVVESELLSDDNNEELQYASQTESGESSESIQSSAPNFTSLFTDEQPVEEPEVPIFEKEDTAQYSGTRDYAEIEVESDISHDEPTKETDPEVAKLAASLGVESAEIDQAPQYSNHLKDDLLLKTEIQKENFIHASDELVMPPNFNEALISYHEDIKEEPNWKNRLKYLKRYFLDNRRKITFYIDGNSIYYLQTLALLTGTKIEKAKSYSLPYEYGNHVITGINDLLSHILENEIEDKLKKSSFGAYFSMSTPSKTITIKSPKLKPGELKELVEWNANKNLPFSTDNKNVNYKILKTELEGETQDVIIGVTETDSVNSVDNIFKRNNLKLNFTSTLPILLWKSFVKNYPDRNIGSYVIIHIGEARTLVIVVTDHVLQFSRKIALGAQDFYKALLKKVETNESGESLDNRTVKDLLRLYGYPQNINGLTHGSNVDLNKVTIAVRPVVERIVSELSRTLNYFKNQKSDLEWKRLFFDGVAASFPGLLESVQESIFQEVELLNPMRTGEYILSEEADITPSDYPNYVLNFALASDEVENLNVATNSIRENYKYSFRSKITAAILAMMIPLFIFSGLYSTIILNREEKAINSRRDELQRLAVDTRDYSSLMGDIKIINSSNHFLKNDRKYSDNQIKMLKLFSSIVPEEIKLIELNFVNATGLPDSIFTDENFKEHLEVAGFVNQDKSVADIYLTDFIFELEKLKRFSNVITLEKNENDYSENSELFFKLRLDIK